MARAGPLVRIGPNELLSTDPDVLRMMSAVRSPYTKGDFYNTGRIVPGVNTVVSERNEAEHKALRAKMAPPYVFPRAFLVRAGWARVGKFGAFG